jgi:hypothetical protein
MAARGQVLGCPPEKRRCVGVGVGVDVRAFVGTLVIVGL